MTSSRPNQRVAIVGGDAGGMAAVSQIKGRQPDTEIVAFEMGDHTSYSACGIPYVVGGVIDGLDDLIARSPDEHRSRGVDLRMRHEVLAVDTAARTLEVRDLEHATTIVEPFDQLLLGTGGTPIRPRLEGIDLPFVRGVRDLVDAAHLIDRIERDGCAGVVVVGSGYIGLEMAEAFVERGCTAIVVDRQGHPLQILDPQLGAIVAEALDRHGIDYRPNTEVVGFEDGVVHTSGGSIRTDLVVLGIGMGPNSTLARQAGLELGVKDAIAVDERQATSVEGIWAAGDCCESTHLVTGKKVHIPLGTYANRQSRVAGINIAGDSATTPRILGTAITKLCGTEIAVTGLNTAQAADAGFDAVSNTIESTTKAGYFPGAATVSVTFVAERGSGRLLGAQVVGGDGAAKRIDTCATAITAGMDVDQVLALDLSYAPPFSPMWDPVLIAAREIRKLV
jgi:NADPH-dependent 2,4-dienoyl-CoA reductase/sulfur reductase-like enzyme